ncbi:hypothetical protein [Nocardia bovistercoris]|uniref:Uncharacterized protein n=1 Tax=Nocardia bovistercoris TaxID=2785916 RepID=A0A931IBK0_9NOCA|nr:hypothetical protein [Nocardia bovistercoris]MBH0778587.1 hypothetical protein [Nocardia bovistercoris]
MLAKLTLAQVRLGMQPAGSEHDRVNPPGAAAWDIDKQHTVALDAAYREVAARLDADVEQVMRADNGLVQ